MMFRLLDPFFPDLVGKVVVDLVVFLLDFFDRLFVEFTG